MEIENKIVQYLEDRYALKQKGVRLNLNTQFLEEKIVDSLGMLELISFVEDTYNIEIPDEDITPNYFGTINKLTGYLKNRMTNDDVNSL